jgi:parvulin-like peptidyl-prolyl isomerase
VARSRLLPLLAVLAVVAAAGCSSSVTDPNAVTVEGDELTIAQLDEELSAIEDAPGYRAVLEQNFAQPLAGLGPGTWSSQFVSQHLSRHVYFTLLEKRLEQEGTAITEADRAQATTNLKAQFSDIQDGEAELESLPESYVERLVRQQAVIAATERLLTADLPEAQAAFDADPSRYELRCVSHILVDTDDRDEDEARDKAEDLKRRLDAGERFADLARAESDDPSSSDGGQLDCSLRGTFVPEFEEAVDDATIGEVTDPVQSEFGFHLILVRERRVPAFEEVGDQVEAQLVQQANDAINAFLLEVICDEDADVSVNPRYGEWDVRGCEAGGLAQVSPPTRPASDLG